MENEQQLCLYRDEAINAKPILLTVKTTEKKQRISSNYFVENGVDIFLSIDEKNRILGLRLGDKIAARIETIKKGMEISPLGLFPAHVLQADSTFDSELGGRVQFGYLKRIMKPRVLGVIAKILFRRLFRLQGSLSENTETDIIEYWRQQYGTELWGVFEVFLLKDENEAWKLYSLSNSRQVEVPIRELIARFKVNSVGIVTGIQDMYAKR